MEMIPSLTPEEWNSRNRLSISDMLANEDAYYAAKDRIFADYQAAVAEGREPTKEQRHEVRRRKNTNAAQAVAAACQIVRRERIRIRREQEGGRQ